MVFKCEICGPLYGVRASEVIRFKMCGCCFCLAHSYGEESNSCFNRKGEIHERILKETRDNIFRNAIFNKNYDILTVIIRNEPDLPLNLYTIELMSAAFYVGKHMEYLEALLSHPNFDPAHKDNYAIIQSAATGHDLFVKRLLKDPRVDPSARNNSALLAAAYNGRTEAVRLLLMHNKVDSSARFDQAITMAMERGHYEIAMMLRAIRVTLDDDSALAR